MHFYRIFLESYYRKFNVFYYPIEAFCFLTWSAVLVEDREKILSATSTVFTEFNYCDQVILPDHDLLTERFESYNLALGQIVMLEDYVFRKLFPIHIDCQKFDIHNALHTLKMTAFVSNKWRLSTETERGWIAIQNDIKPHSTRIIYYQR